MKDKIRKTEDRINQTPEKKVPEKLKDKFRKGQDIINQTPEKRTQES